MGNGNGLNIYNIGDTLLSSSTASFLIHNMLHVPLITKNLFYVHKFTLYTNTYIEFHPWHFFVKEQGSGKILLQGKNDGEYKLSIIASPYASSFSSRSFSSRNNLSSSSVSPKSAMV
jgi:hypothetical protein